MVSTGMPSAFARSANTREAHVGSTLSLANQGGKLYMLRNVAEALCYTSRLTCLRLFILMHTVQ